MAEKFKNKYRIKSVRLFEWNYTWNACYFVTICTLNREHYFGEIFDGEMKLFEIGKMAQYFWLEIPNHSINVKLDEFIVMPNHLHGIVIIDQQNNDIKTKNGVGETKCGVVETPNLGVSTTANSLIFSPKMILMQKSKQKQIQSNFWKPGCLGVIINQFKRICTIKIQKKYNIDFTWQTRFYDHIIRNEKSLNYIREYIKNNPKNWKDDQNNQESILNNNLKQQIYDRRID